MKLLKRLALCCLALLVTAESVSAQPGRRRRADLSIPNVAKKDVICFALYTVHDKTLKLTARCWIHRQLDPARSRRRHFASGLDRQRE